MIDYEKKFDTNNIHSVELNLLDGQVLASQSEQVDSKANNLDNLSGLGKLLSKDFGQIQPNKNLKVI